MMSVGPQLGYGAGLDRGRMPFTIALSLNRFLELFPGKAECRF